MKNVRSTYITFKHDIFATIIDTSKKIKLTEILIFITEV